MIEHAVLIGSNSLVGVLTEPELDEDPRRPAIVFLNAGLLHRVGPHRLHVRLARELARNGFSALRFDRSGVGDSPPRLDGLPLHAAAVNDVRNALDFVAAEQGTSSFILFGFCSGADLAFRAALADKRVVGAVLIDGLPYRTLRSRLHDYAFLIMRRASWQRLFASNGRVLKRPRSLGRQVIALQRRDVPSMEQAASGLYELTGRGVRLLLLYTRGREYSYRRQFWHMFPKVRRDHVSVAYFRGADHTFTLRANQDLLVRTINEWIARQW
jgi:pimeloyl-ACP methyl ester carboxylesterase